MSFEIIASRGRVADRTAGAILGAELTARALADDLRCPISWLGEPEAPADDRWEESLPAARQTLAALAAAVDAELAADSSPLVVTNTCAASLATLPRLAAREPEATVLWVDAHGDFNTPESTDSGYLGGMVLAAACGLWDSGHGAGLDPERVIIVGARDIDEAERELMTRSGVRMLAPAEVSAERIQVECGERPVWIHVDWDALEPGLVPAAYRVPEGLSLEVVEEVLSSQDPDRVLGVELSEFEASGDPSEDQAALDRIRQMTMTLLDRIAQ